TLFPEIAIAVLENLEDMQERSSYLVKDKPLAFLEFLFHLGNLSSERAQAVAASIKPLLTRYLGDKEIEEVKDEHERRERHVQAAHVIACLPYAFDLSDRSAAWVGLVERTAAEDSLRDLFDALVSYRRQAGLPRPGVFEDWDSLQLDEPGAANTVLENLEA